MKVTIPEFVSRLTSALLAGDGVGVGAALGGVVAAVAKAVEEPLRAQDAAAGNGA